MMALAVARSLVVVVVVVVDVDDAVELAAVVKTRER